MYPALKIAEVVDRVSRLSFWSSQVVDETLARAQLRSVFAARTSALSINAAIDAATKALSNVLEMYAALAKHHDAVHACAASTSDQALACTATALLLHGEPAVQLLQEHVLILKEVVDEGVDLARFAACPASEQHCPVTVALALVDGLQSSLQTDRGMVRWGRMHSRI